MLITGTQDFPPPGSFSIGPIKLAWDSKSVTISGGEGVIGSAKYQWSGTLSGQPETTLGVGLGVQGGAGPFSAEASATVSMTFVGQTPVDMGVGMSAEAGAGVGGIKDSVDGSLSTTLRSGPVFSANDTASVGGLGTGVGSYTTAGP